MKKKGERRENLKYFSFVEYRKSYQQIYLYGQTHKIWIREARVYIVISIKLRIKPRVDTHDSPTPDTHTNIYLQLLQNIKKIIHTPFDSLMRIYVEKKVTIFKKKRKKKNICNGIQIVLNAHIPVNIYRYM